MLIRISVLSETATAVTKCMPDYMLLRPCVAHRRDPKPAVPAEINDEEHNIGSVFNGTCPVRAVVERVTITPGGVFMVCWNVLSGGEPAMIRRVRPPPLRRPCHVSFLLRSCSGWTLCRCLVGADQLAQRRLQNLREALPRSPKKQLLSDEPILHTTLARVLKAPVGSSTAADASGALKSAAWQLSRLLCGVEARAFPFRPIAGDRAVSIPL